MAGRVYECTKKIELYVIKDELHGIELYLNAPVIKKTNNYNTQAIQGPPKTQSNEFLERLDKKAGLWAGSQPRAEEGEGEACPQSTFHTAWLG